MIIKFKIQIKMIRVFKFLLWTGEVRVFREREVVTARYKRDHTLEQLQC